jgi:hypothetical protein
MRNIEMKLYDNAEDKEPKYVDEYDTMNKADDVSMRHNIYSHLTNHPNGLITIKNVRTEK